MDESDTRKLFIFMIHAVDPVTMEVRARNYAEALDTFERHYVGSHPYSLTCLETISFGLPGTGFTVPRPAGG